MDATTVDRRMGRSASAVNLLLTLLFVAFFAIQLRHHQMWRDELNVFGIAMASPTLSSLLAHVHYEGHPFLWYFLIWCGTHFLPHPMILKIVQAVVGCSIILIIGLLSPFNLLEKLLLFCSYFLLFEYTVLSRTYGVCVLLALLYLHVRVRYPRLVLLNALLLGLMANADVFGCFLCAGFAFEYAFFVYRDAAARRSIRSFLLLLSPSVLAGFLWFSYWSARPPFDVSWRTSGHIFARSHSVVHYISAIANYVVLPYFPVIVDRYPHMFWGALALWHPVFFTLMIPVILAAYWLVLRRDPVLSVMMAIVTCLALFLAFFVLMGHMRNFGVTFVAFVAALWIQRSSGRRPKQAIVVSLLSLTALGGVAACFASWHHPFSQAERTAAWLRTNGLAAAELTGFPDTSITSIAELLGRPVYMLECRCSDAYLSFSSRRDHYQVNEFGQRVQEGMQRWKAKTAVLLMAHPLTEEQRQDLTNFGLRTKPLAQFTGAEAYEEDFYVFRLSWLHHE